MSELLLVATVAGQRVAFPALAVKSLIEIEKISPVPRASPHVAGLAAVRSRMLTVIDCSLSLGLPNDVPAGVVHTAIEVEHEGHAYALLVDSVEEVSETQSERAPIMADVGQGWDRVTLGRVETDGQPLHLISAAKLIAGPDELSPA